MSKKPKDDPRTARRIRAIKAAARTKAYRDVKAYWEPRVEEERQAFLKYYAGYGEARRRVAELEATVGILAKGVPTDKLTFEAMASFNMEHPSMWELACAFADPNDLNRHP